MKTAGTLTAYRQDDCPDCTTKSPETSVVPFVSQVAQFVAEQAEAQHGHHDGYARHECGVSAHLQEALRFTQHAAPAWRLRRRAQAQETECRLGQDGHRKAQTDLHDYR